VKQLKVSVPNNNNNNCIESPWCGQTDDGFGSLPDTPTDFGRSSRALSQPHPPADKQKEQHYAESIPTDDGIYTSSEEVGGAALASHPPPSSVPEDDYLPSSSSVLLSSSSGSSLADSGGSSSSETTSERLSVISGEDASELGSVSDGGLMSRRGRLTSEAGGEEGRTGSRTGSGAERPRHHQSGGQRERAVATKICTGSFSRGIERFRSESPAALRGAAGADS
jgi:hypothetical protein